MKYLSLIGSTVILLLLVFVLDNSMFINGKRVPALGRLLSPFTGFWQQIEVEQSVSDQLDIQLSGLHHPVRVRFDDRAVPHIFANDLHDAVMTQAYLTARDRLFQMEMSTRAAAGRLAELMGPSMADYDRQQLRKGLRWSAEKSLLHWQQQPESYALVEAYAEGVNQYIRQLRTKDLPVEYKLLDFYPEEWSPYKSALLMESMAWLLCAREDDLEATRSLQYFGSDTFDIIYPERMPYDSVIVDQGGRWPAIFGQESTAAPKLSAIPNFQRPFEQPDPYLGSNNWAVHGSKTKTGAPLLANDPHLPLSLPSIWYELQISLPETGVYGVSLPGFPMVVIGYNQKIAWGLTNVGQDVMDWYRIDWVDRKKGIYRLDGKETNADKKMTEIPVRGADSVLDTTMITHWGPVVFDDPQDPQQGWAMKWLAHDDRSNQVETLRLLFETDSRAGFQKAISNFGAPPQNMVYADRKNNIGMFIQGQFPLKRDGQGRFVQDGNTTQNDWQGFIPTAHQPWEYNPDRAYVSSANQLSTDSTYPYYYHGGFADFRGRYLSQQLNQMEEVEIEDMMALQNDNTSLKAIEALPTFLQALDSTGIASDYIDLLKDWDHSYRKDAAAPVIFELLYEEFYRRTWDEIWAARKELGDVLYPEHWRTIDLLRTQNNHFLFDDRQTERVENANDIILASFSAITDSLDAMQQDGRLSWGQFKPFHLRHLTRLPAFSYMNMNVSGTRTALNAISTYNGPSWRMIVSMEQPVKAYGIYPGGQSGNPGSPYYDNMVNDWAEGQYYELLYLQSPDDTHERLRGMYQFNPADQ